MDLANEPLRALLDRAQNDHAEQPAAYAQALMSRAAQLPIDADGGDAIRLAEHVMLAHLADVPGLQGFLAQLPAAAIDDEATAPAVQRARWCIARLLHQPEPELAPALRWRSLHSAVMAAVHQGRRAQADAWLRGEETAALASTDPAAVKSYAVTANNVALDLRLGARGDALRDALMLEAAAIARRAWQLAGTWVHVERAEYQLAQCHATLGQGSIALKHAQACLRLCEAERADAAELFFAHEALVLAHLAAGDADAARGHREQMAGLLPQVADEGLRGWCAQTLATLAE
jgi:hypothetical protein